MGFEKFKTQLYVDKAILQSLLKMFKVDYKIQEVLQCVCNHAYKDSVAFLQTYIFVDWWLGVS